jgi:aryl-alcohol dehydrogenase-like predicted oxidoreductase
VHPITALQTEYSLWTRDPELEILPACRELGIGFVAYSPIGRGFLAGRFASPQDFGDHDYRTNHPRFHGENLMRNQKIRMRLQELALQKHCTPAQLALAWLLSQGTDIVPIPGTKHIRYLEENAAAVQLQLTPQEVAELSTAFPPGIAAGERYPEAAMRGVNR